MKFIENEPVEYFLMKSPKAISNRQPETDEKVRNARWIIDVRKRLTSMGENWEEWDSYSYIANGGGRVDLDSVTDEELFAYLKEKSEPFREIVYETDYTDYKEDDKWYLQCLEEKLMHLDVKQSGLDSWLCEHKYADIIIQGLTERDATIILEDEISDDDFVFDGGGEPDDCFLEVWAEELKDTLQAEEEEDDNEIARRLLNEIEEMEQIKRLLDDTEANQNTN